MNKLHGVLSIDIFVISNENGNMEIGTNTQKRYKWYQIFFCCNFCLKNIVCVA